MPDTGHDKVSAAFDKLVKAKKLLDATKKVLEPLVKEADQVSPDDVMEAMGSLVAKGGDAKQIAGMMATMPVASGQPLAAWVMDLYKKIMGLEQQLLPKLEMARHQTAVTGMQRIMKLGKAQRAVQLLKARGPQALGLQAKAMPVGASANPLGAGATPNPNMPAQPANPMVQ